jgi:hypothetical protein
VGERRGFLLRVDTDLLDALGRWAADELRSLNGQIEFLLRRALVESGRLKVPPSGSSPTRRSGGRGPSRGPS